MAARTYTDHISSGIYNRTTDLTFVTQNTGTFSGASIGLTEKGPAFEVVATNSFTERIQKLGGLNPKFLSSYFARQYLSFAKNYKEIRILGLEGYTNSKGFAITYNLSDMGNQGYAASSNMPFILGTDDVIACLLKPRESSFTGGQNVLRVEVNTYTNPDTLNSDATDERFTLTVVYADSTTQNIVVSLRPGEKDYISKVLGTDPRDKTMLMGSPSPLWVEYIAPSVKIKPTANVIANYYYPTDLTTPVSSIPLRTGNVTIDTAQVFPTLFIDTITGTSPVTVTFTTNHNIVSNKGTKISLPINITGINSPLSSYFFVIVSLDSVELYRDEACTIPVTGNGGYSFSGDATRTFYDTWETTLLNFSNTAYQTPVTPWFVSDVDNSNNVKKLFRLWSISDGESANKEIKIEISNIDVSGNNGKGNFDLIIRSFDDTEDINRNVLEAYKRVNLDPTSDNYIERQIGNGDDLEIRSKYVFIEMSNEADGLDDLLPFGCLGYPNANSRVAYENPTWTVEYDMTKPIKKQILGFANNSFNMSKKLYPDFLHYKNTSDNVVTGPGFHLNPLAAGPNFVAPELINTAGATQFVTNKIANKEKYKFVVAFAGGFDGFNVYKEREWNDTTSKDYEALQIAVQVLEDRESLLSDFSVLVTPDLNIEDHPYATRSVLEMVDGREDALYIYDFAFDNEAVISSAVDTIQYGDMKSKNSAVYFPWALISDEVNKVNSWCPPSIIALGTIAWTATQQNVWQPPAGSTRTQAANLVKTVRRIKLDERDKLKVVNINTLTVFPGSGFEITESRTQQENFSAMSFIHNILLLGYAKKALQQVLRPLLHQLKGNLSSEQFKVAVSPIFERIKRQNGLSKVVISVNENTDDLVTIYGQVEIYPLYPIERIVVDFVIKNDEINFNN